MLEIIKESTLIFASVVARLAMWLQTSASESASVVLKEKGLKGPCPLGL